MWREAECECRQCGEIFWTQAHEHNGATDLADDFCPECDSDEIELLEVA